MTAHYATANRLDELQAQLSGRDFAILTTLRDYRLAAGGQLRRLFFANHSSAEAAARAARHSLRRLANLGLTDALQRRIGGIRAGSTGLVWHLSRTGIRLLIHTNEISRTNQNSRNALTLTEPSLRTLDHTLAITETMVRLRETARDNLSELIQLQPEPGCWRQYTNPFGGLMTLKPDMFAITAASAEFESIWFLEIDRATESRATVSRKAEAYENYRRSGREQQIQGVFPRVAWLTPDSSRAEMIRETLARNLKNDSRIHLALTLDEFIAKVCEPPP